jgi:hypothetical protein
MRSSSAHRHALARVSTNLALGMTPFALLAGLHPEMPADAALPTLLCLLAAMGIAGCLNLGSGEAHPGTPFRRLLSCLLLGSSLAAVPWHLGALPFFPVVVGTGFISRWWLYSLETRDLVAADSQRLALPCLATRLRRSLTWITGAVIPTLVFSGLPALPLLSLSFGLTVFSQWTVAEEALWTPVSRNRTDARSGTP